MSEFVIRPYRQEDEQGWVRCRVLAFLDSAYFDNVLREKERYERPAIEMVAISGGKVVGLIDAECDQITDDMGSGGAGRPASPSVGRSDTASTVFSKEVEVIDPSATIWHLAVHPDWRKQGIATALLEVVTGRAAELDVRCLQAWTRDDEFVRGWYRARGFQQVESYLHVYIDGRDELRGAIKSEIPDLKPCSAFAHYVGEDVEMVKGRFARVHECIRYEMRITERLS